MTLRTAMIACASLCMSACLSSSTDETARSALFIDSYGYLGTENLGGPTPVAGNNFFQNHGTNGRHCDTCHQPSLAWSITPANLQARFAATQGTDPVFRPVDGSGCSTQDVSTLAARRQAYALLLNRALIRIEMPVMLDAEFSVESVDNPYGCNDTMAVSMYRRPLPATNLAFESMVMWDGRETMSGSITMDLEHQAFDATNGHAQASTPLSGAEQAQIVAFETQLYSAQNDITEAGDLGTECNGGPQKLSATQFYLGINDAFGNNPTGAPFNPAIFDLYANWLNDPSPARSSIARGEVIFNTRPIVISNVAGLNDVVGQPLIVGSCGTCHNTPNTGSQSLPRPMDIGLTTVALRTPDMPLLTLVNKMTGEKVQVTDPGRALVTGKWADISKFKAPALRGLAARPPYFHDGSALGLPAVVKFYDTRFNLQLSAQEQTDLVAFLAAL